MKLFTLIISIFINFNVVFANEVNLEDAPIEFLMINSLKQSFDDHGHLSKNKSLVNDIFKNIHYNIDNDEIIISKNKNLKKLRSRLINLLQVSDKSKAIDPLFLRWEKESAPTHNVSLYRVNQIPEGHYYFNHIHTNISQDNRDLKYLKISPYKTYKYIDRFLRKRRTIGTTSFTDHDTDKAFDLLNKRTNSRLKTLRGIEWGGSTHMCLIDIKKDWKELSNGRKYSGIESIIKSRTSGGFRIVNHPNRKKEFHHSNWSDANGVEVWNTLLENSPFLRLNLERSNNRRALTQWTESLKKGKKYTAMAGSDFHFIIPCLRDRSLIYPVNFIPTKNNKNTRMELEKGNTSFLTRPDAPKLTLIAKYASQRNWKSMGETIKGSGKVQINLFGDFSDTNKRLGGSCYNIINSFYRLLTFWKKRFWEVRFYNKSGDLIAKRLINPKRFNYKRHFKAVLEVPMEKHDLIRAELWQVNRKSQSIDLLGATNPVYIGY